MVQIQNYWLSAITLSASVGQFGCSTAPSKPQTFKNVIIIVGDDHVAGVVGAYGNSIVRTPNLDRLAKSGVQFEHAYCNSPISSPSRQSIEFINQNKDNRFLLWIGFEEPHMPFNFPVDFPGKYDPQQFTLPEGSPEDDRWIPAIFKDLTEAERKGIIAAYYTSVEFLDKNIGLVLDS